MCLLFTNVTLQKHKRRFEHFEQEKIYVFQNKKQVYLVILLFALHCCGTLHGLSNILNMFITTTILAQRKAIGMKHGVSTYSVFIVQKHIVIVLINVYP